ncbi:LptF/LptG family permease [Sphingobacterium rhinopitheci]|uniref:LptF/LptG family permease n=1 Tax=Sphingobacterium rhinopitheci TaxID=2781960 RepID=UPI001F52B29A|nr:LptF/LptG family permease [Sphingobacterium rhinopitheci]MCI0921229.1 LptF/LptG family permease [Sphingobacterium rhinopitheci]
MKKVHILILQAFIKPFLVTFCIVMFVLLMLFLFKYIDDLIGKGFEWHVIMELIGYQCAVQLSMALPLSMLLSSIMTFGNLGESYELVAIKAAGISLRNAMKPLFFLVGLFAVTSFLFSDYILPVVNLKMGSLLWDVRNKKADFLIKPGIFNNAIQGYTIRAKGKSKDGTVLNDLIIYQNTPSSGKAASNVLIAKKGYIYNSRDQKYMILKLIDGVRYEDSRTENQQIYDERQQFTRFYFKETEQKFDMSGFDLVRTDESLFKQHHQMLNLRQLKLKSDTNKMVIDSLTRVSAQELQSSNLFTSSYFRQNNTERAQIDPKGPILDYIPKDARSNVIGSAISQVQQYKDRGFNRISEYQNVLDKDLRYDIEWHRKFTLAISCLLLFAVGAPLGAIVRKGGLGAPVVMSIIFFLIYHIISTVAEKSAKDGAITPFWGMWMAIVVLTPLAIFLTYKSTTDSTLFDAGQYKIKVQYALNWLKNKLNIGQKNISPK